MLMMLQYSTEHIDVVGVIIMGVHFGHPHMTYGLEALA